MLHYIIRVHSDAHQRLIHERHELTRMMVYVSSNRTMKLCQQRIAIVSSELRY
jgi:hypothetical protein